MTRRKLGMWVAGATAFAALIAVLSVGPIALSADTKGKKPTGKYPIEFRILADRRRDHPTFTGDSGPEGVGNAPEGYLWVKLDKNSGLESDKDVYLRVHPKSGDRAILVKLDRFNVRETHMSAVYPVTDERLAPAIGFNFGPEGAKLFGALTRAHLPEENGAFKYRLAIIVNHAVKTAPSINSEIRDAGIIEGGGQGFTEEEVNRLIQRLTE